MISVSKKFIEREYIDKRRLLKDIASEIGCHPVTLAKKIKQLGFKTVYRRYWRATKRQLPDRLVDDYMINRKSIRDLSKETGYACLTIRSFLAEKGIKIKKTNKGYKKNDTFFSVPNILNSYWAGFIAADGHLRRGREITISVKSSDKYLLERFRKDIEFEGEVKDRERVRKETKCYTSEILVGSAEMYNDLQKNFNITDVNKSYNLKPPKYLPLDCLKSFIIGYIDGDGHIKHRGPHFLLNITGTKQMLDLIKTVFEKYLGDKTGKAKKMKCHCYRYNIYCNKALKILRWLREVRVEKLSRKWDQVASYENYKVMGRKWVKNTK